MSEVYSLSPTWNDAIRRVEDSSRKLRIRTAATFLLIFAYLALTCFQFEFVNSFSRWNSERGMLFVLDSYAHKDHISMKWDAPEAVSVKFEGGWRYDYFNPDHSYEGKTNPPRWFSQDAKTKRSFVEFNNGGTMVVGPDAAKLINWPGLDEDLTFRRNADGTPYVVGYENRPEELPAWVRVTPNKIEVRPSLYERMQVYKKKVEIHRYSLGWKYFFFDFDSPLRDYSIWSAISLIASGDRLVPDKSNFSLIFSEISQNEIWMHGLVYFSLLETVVMALLGTMLASVVCLPLAFLAARNVTPLQSIRFVLRRLFDFLRGIDMLIWSLIFLRAFGPGVFTGIFAIAFTDTGTLGKLMSEAVENVDKKQTEGIASTGASRSRQHRFGVLPQILPVFISTSLFTLESNTRSAIIIGAMGAGGIGLQFLGALQTGTDFENVAYMAIVVLVTVIGMDMMSSAIRTRLIGLDQMMLFK